PWTHDEVIVIGLSRLLQRQITMDRSPHVFLVPEPLEPHGRDRRRPLSNQIIQRLALPELVIRGMLHHLLNPWQHIESVQPHKISSRSSPSKGFVIVVFAASDFVAFAALSCLPRKIVYVHLAEGAVVEPIVTHPSVDHRAFRNRYFQRRVRIEQSHHYREPF